MGIDLIGPSNFDDDNAPDIRDLITAKMVAATRLYNPTQILVPCIQFMLNDFIQWASKNDKISEMDAVAGSYGFYIETAKETDIVVEQILDQYNSIVAPGLHPDSFTVRQLTSVLVLSSRQFDQLSLLSTAITDLAEIVLNFVPPHYHAAQHALYIMGVLEKAFTKEEPQPDHPVAVIPPKGISKGIEPI